MRKFVAGLIVMAGAFFPVAVSAQTVLDPICKDTPEAAICRENEATRREDEDNNSVYGPNGILTRAAQIIALVVGVASIIVIIVGGIRFTLSNGDSTQVESARNSIIYAVVGLLIALLAQSIVVFVLRRL